MIKYVSGTIGATLLVLAWVTPVSAVTCPLPGERPATADDAVVQNGQLPEGTCYKPDSVGVGQETEQAKRYLLTKSDSGAQAVMGLNAEFACRLANLLRSGDASGVNIRIVSGFRTYAQQADLKARKPTLAANPGSSNHERGLAADIGDRNIDAWTHANAARFGLRFPIGKEPWHIEPVGGGVSRCGNLEAGAALNPRAPSGSVSEWIREQVAPEQQMCALPGGGSVPCNSIKNGAAPVGQAGGGGAASGGSAPSGSAVSSSGSNVQVCSPQFFCLGTELRYRTSTCTEQTYQICPNGCTGNACNPPSAATGVLDAVLSATSSNTDTSTEKEKIPVFDQLMGLLDADPKKNETIATGSPLLLVSGDDVQHLQQSSTTEQVWQQTTYQQTPGPASQTFTSDDLRWSPVPQQQTLQSNSGILGILGNFRTMLLNVLERLRPFGGRADARYLEGE